MSKEKKNTSLDSVVLIEDPFQIPNQAILDAQHSEEPLDLDEGDLEVPTLDEASLARLEAAIESADLSFGEAAESDVSGESFDAEAELKKQIEEDQALQAAERAEAAEAEAQAALEANANAALDGDELQAGLEAILFLADRPLPLKRIRDTLGGEIPNERLESALQSITERYSAAAHGVELTEVAGGWQFRTKPSQAGALKKLTKVQFQRLSRGAMESLAIIAYRQPVLKDEIDKIRGVDSAYFLRLLMERNFIEISGRSDLPGRPILYGTTEHFLQVFGLKDLQSMPPLSEIEAMVPTSEAGRSDADEDPNVRKMRSMVAQMKMDPAGSLDYNPSDDEQLLREIRERVQQIPTSTPYLEAQKEAERQAKSAPAEGSMVPTHADGTSPENSR